MSAKVGSLGGFDDLGAGGQGLDAVLNTLPAFANGTTGAPGGWSLVGERGPELINLRPGAQVMPSPATAALMKPMQFARNDNSGGDTHIHLTMVASGNPRADRESATQAANVLRQKLRPLRA